MNLTPVCQKLSAAERAWHYRHAGAGLRLTGLSGSEKSTLSMSLEKELMGQGYSVYVLHGDNLRNGLNANLGFSPMDRSEKICRVGEVAALLATCELRAPKGLYKLARAGRFEQFTGTSAPYEAPPHCELKTDTTQESIAQSVARLLDYVRMHIPPAEQARC